jgi:NAD(P)-dependent dehydrogenase (short-subunit alcohol dehydrogenase family)
LSPLGIVTGATAGIGYETAVGLARAGWRVVLTGRSAERGADALARLRRAVSGAQAEFALLDLAGLANVAAFAQAWDRPFDLLVNNAGVLGHPTRHVTRDGFEEQFGVNYLAHFALTLLLLPRLLETARPRVVSVSSLAHRRAQIAFDDLQSERGYEARRAYAQSKLANLIFARELQLRASAKAWPLLSLAAHPGWAATEFVVKGFGGLRGKIAQAGFNLVAQSAADGAKPTLHAAFSPEVEPGGYYGPARLDETRGEPVAARIMPAARDPATAQRLWSISEQLSSVRLP